MKSNVSNFICYIGQKYESDRQWEEEQEKRDKKNEKIRLLKYLRISAKPLSWLLEFMERTLDQLTSSMNLDFDTILGKPKQTGLEQFFWN